MATSSACSGQDEEVQARIQPKASLSFSRYVGETIADELLIERLCDELKRRGDEKFVRELINCLESRKEEITSLDPPSEFFRRFRRRIDKLDVGEVKSGFSARLSKHHKYLDSHSRSKPS